MTIKEKKLSIVIDTALSDLFMGVEQVGLAVDNITKKGKLNGWTVAQINAMKIIEFEKIKKVAKKAIEGVVQSAGVLGDLERQSGGNYDEKFTWVATGAKGGICPSCVELNQTVKTYGNWLLFGLPGSAPTYCGSACVCGLIKSDEALKNPVIIERGPKGPRGGKGKLISVYEKSDKPVAPAKDLNK